MLKRFATPTPGNDKLMFLLFVVGVLSMPIWLAPLGLGYPDLVQKFAIFGLFATGFNILFGLTGYLSFGHAAFLGIGSYTAVWSFKLLGMNPLPAIVLAVLVTCVFGLIIGWLSLRRSGIYFSILTLAFAQMCYSLAYSVLTPITNGETGLLVLNDDPRIFDARSDVEVNLVSNLWGLDLNQVWRWGEVQFSVGFYFCAIFLLIGSYIAIRIFRSPFGAMLRAIKTNQNRLNYTGAYTRPYTLAAFVISAAYAGLAGALWCAVDPLAGAERMQWTASGEVVLMTILGGAGTIMGPMVGAVLIKGAESWLPKLNENVLTSFFAFLPESIQHTVVEIVSLFVGEGWHLTLGLLFMIIVIFLPGGLIEGLRRIIGVSSGKSSAPAGGH